MKRAGDLLKDFFDNLNVKKRKGETIFTSWEKIAGPDIAKHTRIGDIRKETIYIEADHPGWVQIVTLKKNLLVMRINELFPEGEIKEIKVILKERR